MIVLPTKVALRACSIKGADMRKHTLRISTFETICKPYLTATILINDSGNLINSLELTGGDPVSFVIDTGIGKMIESKQFILTVQESDQQGDNKRSKLYQITTASESYFNDRANIVQRSDVNIPMTAAAQQIHNQFVGSDAPLNVMMQSLGMIAKTDIGGFITSNKKPFKAINDIISRASYGQYKSGTSVYFRNMEEYIIAPLEHLFATMSPRIQLIEKETWGSDWQDTFNSYNAIIHATTKVEEGSGTTGSHETAATAKQAINMFDVTGGKEVIQQLGQMVGTTALSKFAKGRMGGLPNVLQMDTRRNEPSNDQGMNIIQENLFKAKVKESVNYYIKCPIQAGINIVAGRGFEAKLLPPVGDLNKGHNRVGGLLLAADVHHECNFASTTVQGTTSVRGVSITYNE